MNFDHVGKWVSQTLGSIESNIMTDLMRQFIKKIQKF